MKHFAEIARLYTKYVSSSFSCLLMVYWRILQLYSTMKVTKSLPIIVDYYHLTILPMMRGGVLSDTTKGQKESIARDRFHGVD